MLAEILTGLTIGVHLASVHVPSEPWQQNFNPGVYAMTDDGWTAGVYRNTIDRTSVYAGKAFTYGPFSLVVGVVSGYQHETWHGTKCPNGSYGMGGAQCYLGYTKHALGPMIAPSVLVFDHVRLTYLPGIHTSSVFHLSIETKL
jgi:hypothetical protein